MPTYLPTLGGLMAFDLPDETPSSALWSQLLDANRACVSASNEARFWIGAVAWSRDRAAEIEATEPRRAARLRKSADEDEANEVPQAIEESIDAAYAYVEAKARYDAAVAAEEAAR